MSRVARADAATVSSATFAPLEGFYDPWMILAFSCLAGCGAAFTGLACLCW